ncbi:MAG: TIGR00730 family Rossman fold protein [Minisyncoccia bacterium]
MNIKDWFLNKQKRGNGPVTISELKKIIKKRMSITVEELEKGYQLIEKYPRSVSILGSSRTKENNIYYQKALSLGYRIAKELDYAVITGGGPGIMEAANRGASKAQGKSIGFSIKLPNEQSTNKYVKESVDFEYFFSRKTMLYFSAESYIYFPGGFGTFDEFFEIVTLIQTKKIPRTPVILVGREFWEPLLGLINEKLFKENNMIDRADTEIYKIVDSEDEILEIIKNAPFRQE